MKLVLSGLFAATSVFISIYTVVKQREMGGDTMSGLFFVSFLFSLASGLLLL